MADPFNPKFVDLVRNFTTTQGRGNFVLGAAITGFTSLADAVAVGDRFYYCAINIDKPAEREVGRGTRMADGTIAREPTSGAATNFSSGTKSLALIVAADWFEKAANSTGAGAGAANSRAALAAGAAANGQTAYLAEAGREGQFVFSTADLSAEVAADTAQGLYIAPASAPSGASGAWVRQFVGPVNPRWWGMVSGSSAAAAANSTARDAMLATLATRSQVATSLYHGLEPIQFDHKKYWFSSAWDLTYGCVQVLGTGTGVPNAIGTAFKFPSGSDGFIFQSYDTSGDIDGPGAAHTFAQGSLVRGIRIEGDYAASGVEGEHHGFVLRVPVKLEDCQAYGFEGDGIRVHAHFAGSAATTPRGNANIFQIYNCSSQGNRHGISLAGADANAYTIIGGSFDNNRSWGFHEVDDASLGGLIMGTHFASNGVSTTGTATPSLTTYNGRYYSVFYGQEAGASTNAPSGTTADNTWWFYIGGDGTSPVVAGYPAWVSGMTWRTGGPVICWSVNSASQFLGCYSEAGIQGHPQMRRGWVIGGTLAGHTNKGAGGFSQYINNGTLVHSGSLQSNGASNIFGKQGGGGTYTQTEWASPAYENAHIWKSYGGGESWDAYTGSYGTFGLLLGGSVNIGFKIGAIPSLNSPTIATLTVDGFNLAAGKTYKIDGTTLIGLTDGDKGDVTVSASGATWTIDAGAVTYAKMQDVSATARFIGRITAGAGDAEELTGTQATTLLDPFSTTVKGLVPAPGTASGKFLKDDGTWAASAISALTMNNSGTGAASGTAFDGSVATTISWNSIGALAAAAPVVTGSLIDITGNPSGVATIRHTGGVFGALVIENTGGTFGDSRLTLANESGSNGAIFETTSAAVPLVDFIFKTGASGQHSIRYERRTGSFLTGMGNTNYEFQIGFQGSAAGLVVGDTATKAFGNLGVTGKIATAASGATNAGLNLPHGAAPTSPVNGDLWSTDAGFYGQVNGATVSLSGTGTGTVTSVGVTAPAAGITSSGGPVTTSGSITLALANDLAAVEGLATTGIVRRTAADTWSAGTAVDLASEVTGVLPVANGGAGYSVENRTAGYTETATSGEKLIKADLAAGFTIVLPPAVGNTAKLMFKKMQAAGSIILDGNGSETIDGSATRTLSAQHEAITIVSDNANWVIV